MGHHAIKYFTFFSLLFVFQLSYGQETVIKYLSGTGNDHTVNWQFYCTAGRNSGKWTTIPVPSNWELQGFGKYNYGLDKDTVRGKESGFYKYSFNTPVSWKGKTITIVFEGSMTDTRVKINGKSAGAIHQGSFYRFKYDISNLLKMGRDNLLEVIVDKHSANSSVNGAERKCDYWLFGGLFRPVYLEITPQTHINRVAINGNAKGQFFANVFVDKVTATTQISGQIFSLNGQKVSSPFQVNINKGDSLVTLQTNVVSPKLWSPEFPNL